MAIEKKSLQSKTSPVMVPAKKKTTTKAKVDTKKPDATKVVAAMRML